MGFALKLDDIPENYPFKYQIIRFESFYWEKVLPYKFRIYDVDIDTTFALYKLGKYSKDKFYNAIQTWAPYIARHLCWYCFTQDFNGYYINKGNVSTTSYDNLAIENSELAAASYIVS